MTSRPFNCLVALALASLLACRGTSRAPRAAVSPVGPEVDLGLEELRKSLESTVLENYLQLTYGNIEAFLDGVAVDRQVQFIGVTPRDVVVGVNPPALEKDRRLYRHRQLRILSKNLDVHLSEDGSVGWVYDEVSYRVEYMGREASIPIRSTAVYVRDVERWILVSEHLSYGIPVADLKVMIARGEFIAGASMTTRASKDKGLSASLIRHLTRFVNGDDSEPSVFQTDDTLLLLPGPEQEYHGSDALQALGLAQHFDPEASVAVRDSRVELSSSKRVAWLVCNLLVNMEFNDEPMQVPLRGSFVFEKRGDEGWGIVQAHISAPLSESELSALVFGPNED